jgi:uncharacterized protein YndB with AHSA1/START domain
MSKKKKDKPGKKSKAGKGEKSNKPGKNSGSKTSSGNKVKHVDKKSGSKKPDPTHAKKTKSLKKTAKPVSKKTIALSSSKIKAKPHAHLASAKKADVHVHKKDKHALKPAHKAVHPGKDGKHPGKDLKAVHHDSKLKLKPAAADGKKPAGPPNKAELAERQKKFEEIFSKKRAPEKNSSGVLAITNTIPSNKRNDISSARIASISSSITNPVKRTDSYSVRAEKEPAGKFELEFVVHSSAEMLFEFISTPSGLSEWFCDDLNIRNGIYTFIWEDTLQQARLLKTVDQQCVRFQWTEKNDGSYFEFKIQRDDLTNDISLIITDFAESAGDRESSKLLWNSQVEKLMQVLGSIY